ncbi:MAG: 30S ribosomal protein S8e [Thermoplasmata archaeon]|jgi:small subunit ribosomal protein S8e|nr:30S ribosomal protein S8e [Thermoplasmata archaeon]
MALWQGESRRKPTGGRLVFSHGKRKFEMSREKQYTRLTVDREAVLRQYRGMGGNYKVGMLTAQYANVIDKKTNTAKKVAILNVVENPSDPNFVQRNIINKGAKIKTELGIAVVTSRPGQCGAINAVLVDN